MRELEYPTYPSSTGPRLRWSEIIAGTSVTLALLVALNFLGVGLGFLPADVDIVPAAAKTWWPMASGAVAFFAGGWFASRLSDSGGRADGVIYGLVCWAASVLGGLVLPAETVGGVLSVASGVLVFATMVLEGVAAAVGGLVGARLYVPVPVSEYHRTRRHPAALSR